ncbi:MAG: YccF domain-containing protein [Solirubrobacterales bacterium]|nr:YccF domain-containing protein [Solirubrobacterales bacterium]
MRLILNVLWLLLGGFWMAMGWLLAALVMFILIITIPFGVQAVKIAGFTLWPFGRTLVKRGDAGIPSMIGNVIWFLLAGWWLALAHLITAVLLAITIIGIPLAAAHIKLVPISLMPFGREVLPVDSLPAGSDAVVVAHRR